MTMTKTMPGVLEFPSSYQVMDEEEMMYVEGGIAVEVIVGIIVGVGAIGGGFYAVGNAAGKSYYYRFGKNTWNRDSKIIAAACFAVGGVVGGALLFTGFYNGYKDTQAGMG